MNTNNFALRHIGPRELDCKKMLETIGVDSIDQLIYETIPDEIRLKSDLNLENAMSEQEYLSHIHELSKHNKTYKTYIGLGYHPTILPAVIQRNILENPGWYTAYTPYQAEIAQGRLEALLNFQTMITDLTGMELANASLLDESTAAAEAMSLLFAVRSRDQKKAGVNKFFVSENILPQTLSLLETRGILIHHMVIRLPIYPEAFKGKYNEPRRFGRPSSKRTYDPNGFSDHFPISVKILEK